MAFRLSDLLGGNRFWVPLSESALLEAGDAAQLGAGMTLLEANCGNGAASIFLSEEFHLYARGFDPSAEVVSGARELARRSSAARRIRILGEQLPNGYGPVDLLCCLRGPRAHVLGRIRRGGRMLWGRFVAPGLADLFPQPDEARPGEVIWKREATPLEWERFLSPQERVLRRYRRTLKRGDAVAPLAIDSDRRIAAFRAHGSCVSYELSVVRLDGG